MFGSSGYQPSLTLRKARSNPRNLALASAAANRIGSWYKSTKNARAGQKNAARFRQRNRSMSMSVTSSGPRKGTITQESNSSKTHISFGNRPFPLARNLGKVTAPQQLTYNYPGANLQSAVGTQFAGWYPWYDYTILHAIEQQAPNLPVLTSRVLHEFMSGEILLANASVFTTTMIIYDVMARRDLHLGLASSAELAAPTGAWSTGVTDEGGGANDWKVIGGTPFQSELFNQFYRVVQTTRVELNPGGIHRHVASFRPNKIVHNEVVEANSYGIQGLSCYTMVVLYGQPAHDSTTTTSVTITAASLDVVQSANYRYRYIQEGSTDFTKTNQLAASFAVGPQIVNDEVGQTQDAAGLKPTVLLS